MQSGNWRPCIPIQGDIRDRDIPEPDAMSHTINMLDGAKGGTRTRTGVTRWNLNPVRLPIPPLSRSAGIETKRAGAF
jgi:hypothetical protein